jgi:hypothetical protein
MGPNSGSISTSRIQEKSRSHRTKLMVKGLQEGVIMGPDLLSDRSPIDSTTSWYKVTLGPRLASIAFLPDLSSLTVAGGESHPVPSQAIQPCHLHPARAALIILAKLSRWGPVSGSGL